MSNPKDTEVTPLKAKITIETEDGWTYQCDAVEWDLNLEAGLRETTYDHAPNFVPMRPTHEYNPPDDRWELTASGFGLPWRSQEKATGAE